MSTLDTELLSKLACPIEGGSLAPTARGLECEHGHVYPVVEGVPVLLRADVTQTIGLTCRSLEMARDHAAGRCDDPLFVDTLGISDQEKRQLRDMLAKPHTAVDPVVSFLVGATNGILYKGLIGRLDRLPIPVLSMPPGEGRELLDIGCSWGRWSMAAAGRGYRPIGLDPSLGAVLAAQRLAADLGLPFHGIVGDARHLPLKAGAVDAAYSYSVLQHFAKEDAARALSEIARVTRHGGLIKIQMASAVGVRSFQHMARRRFRQPVGFEVRYWLPHELLTTYRKTLGNARLSVDGYFGLGLQSSDAAMMTRPARALLRTSDLLRAASRRVPPLVHLADSLFVTSDNCRSTGSIEA